MWCHHTGSAKVSRLLTTSVPAFWTGDRLYILALMSQPHVSSFRVPLVLICASHTILHKASCFILSFPVCLIETEFRSASQADSQLSTWPRLALNSQPSSCLSWITGMSPHAQLRLLTKQASLTSLIRIPLTSLHPSRA